jgi:hypothetical protein
MQGLATFLTAPTAILQDVFAYIFPMVVALLLFLPFFGEVDLGIVLVAGIVLGYVVSPTVNTLSRWLYRPRILPWLRKKHDERVWHSQNWDYDRLYILLEGKDAEALNLESSHCNFYRALSIYFAAFFIANLLVFATGFWSCYSVGVCSGEYFLSVFPSCLRCCWAIKTPVLAGRSLPTLLAIAGSPFLAWCAHQRARHHYGSLFSFYYPELSRKYHEEKGRLATSIFGELSKRTEAGDIQHVEGATIHLMDADGRPIAKSTTDRNGRFQFERSKHSALGYCDAEYTLKAEECSRHLAQWKQSFAEKKIGPLGHTYEDP